MFWVIRVEPLKNIPTGLPDYISKNEVNLPLESVTSKKDLKHLEACGLNHRPLTTEDPVLLWILIA